MFPTPSPTAPRFEPTAWSRELNSTTMGWRRASATTPTASSIFSGPEWWQSPATPSRPRGCCSSPPTTTFLTDCATTKGRSAAMSWCRAPRRRPDASTKRFGCSKVPLQRSAPSTTTRPIPTKDYKRGFSIQNISPLPITWAEHVAAQGHWGEVLREYMRDYVHWSTLGRSVRVSAPVRQCGHPGRRDRPPRTSCRQVFVQPVRQRHEADEGRYGRDGRSPQERPAPKRS